MEQAISRDPEVIHGTLVFRGTRVPVQTLFECLEGGDTVEDFLEGFPTVSRDLARPHQWRNFPQESAQAPPAPQFCESG